MPTEDITPVTIVGAGPVGLMLANLLCAYNIPVTLFERHLTTVKAPRAVSIDDESLRSLQIAGLADRVRNICAMDYGSIYLGPDRKPFASVSPSAAEYGHPRRSAFAQPELEALLADSLGQYPGLRIHFGQEVVGIEQSDTGVTLEVQAQDGSRHKHHSRYVAACDGGRSPIRHLLHIDMKGHTYEKKWLILDLKGTRDNFRETRVYCDPRRPGINLPGPNGTRRFEFMLLDGETDEQVTDAAFVSQLLRDHGPDDGIEIVRKQVYPFHALMATEWKKRAVFLLGDAAHLTPPFAGQGLNSGLRDASNLAWKLASVIHGQLGPAVLESYADERPEHAWELINMAIKLGRVMMPDTMLKARLIQAGFRALKWVPPANDYITQMRYKPKPRFSKGFIVADGANLRTTRVGRMLPQPEVEADGRSRHRLDEILGKGFALIAFHPDPPNAFSGLPELPFEARLGLRRICITPRHYNIVPGTAGTTTVRDMHADFERNCASARESWLLVRPDRYVMACIPRSNPQATVETLSRMLHA
ncbi:MAG: bifunctional 3-(3-hydroxy-phenyl)propionate/3-hydroxycinnamic acid hydroxylase [Burkholderiaceae bacterium]|nr:MAG: bifunctional 3-(3-hydroxy-phenyl)propionate/3-hydroxycinnamic acid hydroxylase [Burkholderiaceae bacterium]TAM08649.1 MAG: bifunctional 3-(3-hydroxy-phenyl)propionate/3-hydroxycinnamic acid hydroxylase [Pusillimonas sp.]